MIPYNVDIFDRTLTAIGHDQLTAFSAEFDYLSPTENSFSVLENERVVAGGYIHVTGDNTDYFGYISGVTHGENRGLTMTIHHKAFVYGVFDTSVLIDYRIQYKTYTDIHLVLEEAIKKMIVDTFVKSTDSEQNLPVLSENLIETTSSTDDWTFNITPTKEGGRYTFTELYETIMAKSLFKYGVVVLAEPNFMTKKVSLKIGKVNPGSKLYFEANLPNVISASVTIRQSSSSVNKLMVYNEDDFTKVNTYYLYRDGTYSMTKPTLEDRMLPVVLENRSTSVGEGETFQTATNNIADDVFGGITYDNLIELNLSSFDGMYNPSTLSIGQNAVVIHNDTKYDTMLTGMSYGLTTNLIFGMIRANLTDKIVRR